MRVKTFFFAVVWVVAEDGFPLDGSDPLRRSEVVFEVALVAEKNILVEVVVDSDLKNGLVDLAAQGSNPIQSNFAVLLISH